MKKNVWKLFVLLMALLVVGCGKKDEAVTNEGDSGSEYERERAEAFQNLRGDWNLTKVYDTESGEMTDWMRTQDKVAAGGQDLVSDNLGKVGEGISDLVDKTGAFHQPKEFAVTAEDIDLTILGRGMYNVSDFEYSIKENVYYFVSADQQGNGF
ncbi:MAG: hypothetical protein J6N53_00475 [Lachnospiraceae bacterium]|nr:hypothetical protein [Lachnospiraceae bacterium]